MEVPTTKTMDEDEVKVYDFRSSEVIFTMSIDYHLTCDMVSREIVPSQGYSYVGLGCYALNVDERLQKLYLNNFRETF